MIYPNIHANLTKRTEANNINDEFKLKQDYVNKGCKLLYNEKNGKIS